MLTIKPNYSPGTKNKNFKIYLVVILGYFLFACGLYNYFSLKSQNAKFELLKEFHAKIVSLSEYKINLLYSKLASAPKNNNIAVTIQNHNLEMCKESNCVKYNLIKFGALLGNAIPSYIHYKVELNNNVLYSDAKLQKYELESKFHISDYLQLNVGVNVDPIYWSKEEQEIWAIFWVIVLCFAISIIILYLLHQKLHKHLAKKYELDYQNKYQNELTAIKIECESNYKKRETILMQQSWNSNFNKQKDLEINYIFALENNNMTYYDTYKDKSSESAIRSDKRKFLVKMPCSIVLYQEGSREEISILNLVNIFTERFSSEAENISFEIISPLKTGYFSTQAALYQIIYSIISYLFFLLKNQSSTVQYKISLYIDIIKDVLILQFTYNGLPINSEVELLKASHLFFKSHANPFLLSLQQVFNILEAAKFNCNTSHDDLNYISISPVENIDTLECSKESENIILFKRKKND